MRVAEKPITFGVIVGTRGFFNPALAVQGRKDLLAKLDRLGYKVVVPPEDATANGAIETRADARKCAELFRAQRDEIDGVIVSLPNFGDEVAVVETLATAALGVPVLVQATDDDIDKVDVAHRRDAFCGKLSVCNNLYQYGIPFTDTSRHTCKIASDAFTADLDAFARVCRVVRGLRSMRLGAIGARPAAFRTVRASEKLLQTAGITVIPVDLSEILADAQRLKDDDKVVRETIGTIKNYGKIPSRIKEEQILRQAKLTVTINRWMEANECDASAIQCWSSVQQNYGCATCLTMSLMGQKLMPSACEVDITGAVSMYALALASGRPAGFLDWNNNYGDDPDKCVNTHCSNYPKDFVGGEIEISELDILGATLGRERCFGAIKAKVKAGPMTFFRMDTDDKEGRLRAYVGEGEFTDDPFGMDGGIAVCRIRNLRSLLENLCRYGWQHHVAMVRGNWARAVKEAVGRYLKWDLYVHE
jgi:L-fucose isomerase-like protein